MNVLVTGAAGHLGSHLVTALAADFAVTGTDLMAPHAFAGGQFVTANLAERSEIDALLCKAGKVDCVVHCASIHPWKEYPDAQYLDANVKGCWQLYSALEDAGIKHVVLTSSIAVNGYHAPPECWPVNEEQTFATNDLYCLTKRMQEEIARHFAARGRVKTIALRPPAFMPRPERETGRALLGPFAVVGDIVSAHVAAVRVQCGLSLPAQSPGPFEAIFVANSLPYTQEDFRQALSDGHLGNVVRKHFPFAAEWMGAQEPPGLPGAFYCLERARAILHWQPKYNFPEWFSEHVAGSRIGDTRVIS